MSFRDKDYYKILQVDPSAHREVIEAAYRRLAFMYHPDVNKSPDATLRMQEINAAYGVLHSPAKRAHYDRERSAQSSGADAKYGGERRKREEAEAGQRRAQEEAQAVRRRAEEAQRKREETEAAQRRAQEEAQAVRRRAEELQRKREETEAARNVQPCRGCGQSIKKSYVTCPHCGYTDWGSIVGMFVVSIACISGTIFCYFNIQDEILRIVVSWGGGILGVMFMIVTIGEAITGIRKPKPCPHKRDTNWGVIVGTFAFSIACISGTIFCYFNIQDEILRNVVGWGGGFFGVMFMMLVIGWAFDEFMKPKQ